MFGTRFRCLLLTVVLLAPSAHAQDTQISSARFTLIEKSEPALTVTLENLRDVPLVAWETATLHEDSTQPATVSFHDRRSKQGNAPENGATERPAAARQQVLTDDLAQHPSLSRSDQSARKQEKLEKRENSLLSFLSLLLLMLAAVRYFCTLIVASNLIACPLTGSVTAVD